MAAPPFLPRGTVLSQPWQPSVKPQWVIGGRMLGQSGATFEAGGNLDPLSSAKRIMGRGALAAVL